MYRIIIAFACLFLTGCQQGVTFKINGRTMGTAYLVKVANRSVDANTATKIETEIEKELAEINRQMSTWQEDSEISRFNRWKQTEPFQVSEDFMNVLMTSIGIYEESGGAFDITVGPLVNLWGFGSKELPREPPSKEVISEIIDRIGTDKLKVLNDSMIIKSNPDIELDMAAIAKGYGVDKVASVLDSMQFEHYLVEIGGEVVVRGLNGNKKWRIGIDRPVFDNMPGDDLQAILEVTDIAMATSGDYRNYFVSEDSVYSHTIDPALGRPIINGVASVTILAPRCAVADAMATAIMVMGADRGLQWVELKNSIETMIILREGENYREIFSSGFKEYMTGKKR